jgi:hypothetical protein
MTKLVIPLLTLSCRTLADCLVDDSLETMLGSRHPPPPPAAEKCALTVGKQGAKFVGDLVALEVVGRENEVPAKKTAARDSASRACQGQIPVPVDLGGDCIGKAGDEALVCLFDTLERMNPLP